MSKVYYRGQRLGSSDLKLVCHKNGTQCQVSNVAIKIYKITGGVSQMTLNNLELREENGVYWVDAMISFGMSPGDYVIVWEFEAEGIRLAAKDEFKVI